MFQVCALKLTMYLIYDNFLAHRKDLLKSATKPCLYEILKNHTLAVLNPVCWDGLTYLSFTLWTDNSSLTVFIHRWLQKYLITKESVAIYPFRDFQKYLYIFTIHYQYLVTIIIKVNNNNKKMDCNSITKKYIPPKN